jgi:hypothetical protein
MNRLVATASGADIESEQEYVPLQHISAELPGW